MLVRKVINWPWRIMLAIACITVAVNITNIVFSNISIKVFSSGKGLIILVFSLLFSVLLFLECWLYFKIRRKIYSVLWTRIHVILMIFVFILLPLFWTFLISYNARIYNVSDFEKFAKVPRILRPALHYVLFIVATIFFIMNFKKSYSRKDDFEKNKEDGLLYDLYEE